MAGLDFQSPFELLFGPGVHAFLLVKDAEADDALRIPGLELDRPEEVFFRFLAVPADLGLGQRQKQEIIPLVVVHPDGFLQVLDRFFIPGLAVQGLALAEARVRVFAGILVGVFGREARAREGATAAPGVVRALYDFVMRSKSSSIWRFQMRVEIAAETIGMEFPGQLEVSLLDFAFVGLSLNPKSS